LGIQFASLYLAIFQSIESLSFGFIATPIELQK
jgi:hypothetical protein